ncbi:nitroreductase, partial [Companilactobacillus ginsenosidimutans]|uniref:nitroreductase n=1 Tax=Companilactobacillus ginsenosidimutans TaxID=1007676 RepID=UPI0006612687
METLQMISSRKAIRQYSGQISDDQLHEILLAGNAGPVGLGQYNDYHITVIQGQLLPTKVGSL